MKRYLLFHGVKYEASGGMFDFIADFDTLEEAKKFLHEKLRTNWDYYFAHIWDIQESKMVWLGNLEETYEIDNHNNEQYQKKINEIFHMFGKSSKE